MIYSSKHTDIFYRNFRAKYETLENFNNLEDTIDNSKVEKEILFDNIDNNRKRLCWYENTLLEEYIQCNFNQMELHRKTKIPYQSIVKTIALIKKKLKDE
jgi:hypothetical protein